MADSTGRGCGYFVGRARDRSRIGSSVGCGESDTRDVGRNTRRRSIARDSDSQGAAAHATGRPHAAMKLAEVRRFALSLPETTEEPHFYSVSFRVTATIFATVPPEDKPLHVFVDGAVLDVLPAAQPKAYEKLFWGKRVAYLRVAAPGAEAADAAERF